MGIRRTKDSGRKDTMGRKIWLADNLNRQFSQFEESRRKNGALQSRAKKVMGQLVDGEQIDEGIRNDMFILMNRYDAHIAQTQRTLDAMYQFEAGMEKGDLTDAEYQELRDRNTYYQGVLKTAYAERAMLGANFDIRNVEQGGTAVIAEQFVANPTAPDWTGIITDYNPGTLPEPVKLGDTLKYTATVNGKNVTMKGTVIAQRDDGTYVQWDGIKGENGVEYPITGPHTDGEFSVDGDSIAMTKHPLASETASRVGTASEPADPAAYKAEGSGPTSAPTKPMVDPHNTPRVYPVQKPAPKKSEQPLPSVSSPADTKKTVVVNTVPEPRSPIPPPPEPPESQWPESPPPSRSPIPPPPPRSPIPPPPGVASSPRPPRAGQVRDGAPTHRNVPRPQRAPRPSPEQTRQQQPAKRQQAQQRREKNGAFRVTKRSHVGPFVVHYSMKGVSSVSLRMGLMTYRLWSLDPNSKKGVSSVDLPGPISYRPNKRSRF